MDEYNPETHRRAADPFVITLKDVYDLALSTRDQSSETKSTVDNLVTSNTNASAEISARAADHETRIRVLESMRWKTTASLIVAAFALGAWGTETFDILGGVTNG
jgi:hypothetical protein